MKFLWTEGKIRNIRNPFWSKENNKQKSLVGSFHSLDFSFTNLVTANLGVKRLLRS